MLTFAILIISKILVIITCIFFLFLILRLHHFIRYFRLLHDVDITGNLHHLWPKVSLIVPICNEAETVERAAHSLFSMDYPNIEFIFINDRSTDHTGAILEKLTRKESRLKIINVSSLEEGWLGKTHAFQQGVLAAKGDWLLFSDADVHYHKTSLKKAITYTSNHKLDFLAVVPSIIGGTFAVRLLLAQLMHHFTLSLNFKQITNSRHSEAIAHGAFMLLRRSSFNKSRGFEWLRMEVLDDIGLASEMKRSGAKIGILSGLNEIEFEWYPNLKSLIHGFEKNSFAAYQYSIIVLAGYILAILCIFLGYTIAPIVMKNFWFQISVWSLLGIYLFITGYSLRTFANMTPWVAAFFPITLLFWQWVTLRSAFFCLKQKGIYWRGTFYPLSALKKGQRIKMIKNSLQ